MTDIIHNITSPISAGDSFSWLISLGDYPASEGWSLTIILINSAAKISLISTAEEDEHRVSVSAVVSAEYLAGSYKYVIYAAKDDDRYTVASGDIEILSDISWQETFDGRTFAEKCLDNIEAVISGKASHDNMTYSIGGRSLSKYTWEELLSARGYFKSEVVRDKRKASGKKQGNRILTRFV